MGRREMERRARHRTAWVHRGIAAGMALGLVGVAAGTVLAYRGTVRDLVSPPVLVTVDSDRAGLVMDPGALVTWHGVEVGTVTAVRTRVGGATLHVSLDAETVRDVPANVDVRIAATTVFGAKTVTLVDPPHPTTTPISSGSVIEASSVTVETNTVFESLRSVLVAAQPDKLNTTLGAVSTALAGRGDALGTTLDDAAAVLSATAPLTATLERTVDDAASVVNTAADAAPDLTALLAAATTTARTVDDRRSALGTALTTLTGTATTADRVIAANADGWSSTLTTTRPTSSLLQRYSPMFTCFLQGADIARVGAEKVSGGNGRTMLLNSTVLFGVPPYRYETDLPRVAASGGPRCGALPLVSDSAIPTPYVVADTGSNPFRAGNRSPVLQPNSILDLLPEGLTAPRSTR